LLFSLGLNERLKLGDELDFHVSLFLAPLVSFVLEMNMILAIEADEA
jgi:hypothetical protein